MASNCVTSPTANGLHQDHSFKLHKAAFHGDVDCIKELLDKEKLDPKSQDPHGNTALHIAVMLGHKPVIEELVKHGAPVREKNELGWTPLNEAISYGDRGTIVLLLKTLREQITDRIVKKRDDLIKSLNALEDFHIELKWEFHTWVPFLSRLLPSDVCKIYKKGACIRLESTIGDFQEMKWTRGDKTYIFNGEDIHSGQTLSMVVLDNQKKEYQRLKLLRSDDEDEGIEERVNRFMSHPIVYANMSTKPITVTRAQSGWWFFKGPRSEQVGEYNTDVYDITDLILISRKRRENLTPEQIRQYEHLQKKMESGSLDASDLENKEEEERETVHSLPPPASSKVTWEEYIHAPKDKAPHLGRPMDMKVERKHFKASIWTTKECPIELKKLLDILEVIAPYKHFHKLRDFVSLRMPPGFPVKLEIPVFPTVTAIVTLQQYEAKDTPHSKFLIPRDYKKFEPEKNSQQ